MGYIYLNYSHQDRSTAQAVKRALEQSGHVVWAFNVDGMQHHKPIVGDALAALKRADVVIILSTPATYAALQLKLAAFPALKLDKPIVMTLIRPRNQGAPGMHHSIRILVRQVDNLTPPAKRQGRLMTAGLAIALCLVFVSILLTLMNSRPYSVAQVPTLMRLDEQVTPLDVTRDAPSGHPPEVVSSRQVVNRPSVNGPAALFVEEAESPESTVDATASNALSTDAPGSPVNPGTPTPTPFFRTEAGTESAGDLATETEAAEMTISPTPTTTVTKAAEAEKLAAAISAEPLTGEAPLTVTFYNNSQGSITGYAWDFDGDGITDSTAANPPPYTYTNPGSAVVSLKVSAPGEKYLVTSVDEVVIRVSAPPTGKSPTSSLTVTPTIIPSMTPTMTATRVPSMTPTMTVTQVPSMTPTMTATRVPSMTPTMTATMTPTMSATPIPSMTPTLTNTPVNTPTNTALNTPMNTSATTSAPTSTPTPAQISEATETVTMTYTMTSSPTVSNTPSATMTPTISATPTESPTATPTMTATVTSNPSPIASTLVPTAASEQS